MDLKVLKAVKKEAEADIAKKVQQYISAFYDVTDIPVESVYIDITHVVDLQLNVKHLVTKVNLNLDLGLD